MSIMSIINFIANNIYSLETSLQDIDIIEAIKGFFSAIATIMVLIKMPWLALFVVFQATSLFLNSLIFPLAAYCYTLFPLIAHANLSSLIENLQSIIGRIEIFIGVFMLFVVAFSVLKYMVDPDKEQQNTSKLVYKIVVSIVLLVSSSLIFGLLDDLQDALTGAGSDNLIEVILAGPSENNKLIAGESQTEYENQLYIGRTISFNAFFAMYSNAFHPEEKDEYIENGGFMKVIFNYFDTVLTKMFSTPEGEKYKDDNSTELGGVFGLFTGSIRYEFPILAELLGLFLIVMFLTFAIDIGVRNFTLIFLRALFPVAALGYLIPKSGDAILSKYIKAYISAYIQLFVKIFTVYLMLYILIWIMNTLFGGGASDAIFGDTGSGKVTKVLLLLLLIIALFVFFIKGFPKLMKEVFGVEMGNGLGGALNGALGFAGLAAGLAIGGVAGAAKGAKIGGFGAAVRGAAKGGAQMAKVGWGAGKSAAAGHVGQAISGMTSGVRDVTGRKKKSLNDYVAERQGVIDEANKAVDAYNAAEEKAKELDAFANAPDASEKDKIMAENAKVAAEKAKQNALDKTAKAQKMDKNYKNSLSPKSRKEQKQEARSTRRSVNREVNDAFRQGREADGTVETVFEQTGGPTVVVTPPAPSPENYEYDMDSFATPQFEASTQEIVVEQNSPQATIDYKESNTPTVTPIEINREQPASQKPQQPTQTVAQEQKQSANTTTTEQKTNKSNTVTSNDQPATNAERQSASEYSSKMEQAKETASGDARATLEKTINTMSSSGIDHNTTTPIYENAGGGSGYGYTVYNTNNGYGNSHEDPRSVGKSGKADVEVNTPTGEKYKVEAPDYIRTDANKDDVENLDNRTREERIKGLRSSLDKKRVADRTQEIVAEDGKNLEEAYRQAEDEDLDALSKRIDELISEGLSEAEATEKAIKEYEERV